MSARQVFSEVNLVEVHALSLHNQVLKLVPVEWSGAQHRHGLRWLHEAHP